MSIKIKKSEVEACINHFHNCMNRDSSNPWHVFNDWNDSPDCEGVLVTVENKFGQRFVTEAWWSVGADCKCNWHVIDRIYAENWREGIYLLSKNWKVVAWRYRLEPFKEATE